MIGTYILAQSRAIGALPASLWEDGALKVSESRGSSNANFAPGVLQIGGGMTNQELSACEIAEIFIYQGQLNAIERSQLEGYIAHKWNLTEQILPAEHPYVSLHLLKAKQVHRQFQVSVVT